MIINGFYKAFIAKKECTLARATPKHRDCAVFNVKLIIHDESLCNENVANMANYQVDWVVTSGSLSGTTT